VKEESVQLEFSGAFHFAQDSGTEVLTSAYFKQKDGIAATGCCYWVLLQV